MMDIKRKRYKLLKSTSYTFDGNSIPGMSYTFEEQGSKWDYVIPHTAKDTECRYLAARYGR